MNPFLGLFFAFGTIFLILKFLFRVTIFPICKLQKKIVQLHANQNPQNLAYISQISVKIRWYLKN